MDYKELNHSDLGEVFTSFYSDVDVNDNELAHHGIKGMKWGIRKYQNSDGSLTAAGRKRYAKLKQREGKAKLKAKRKAAKAAVKAAKKAEKKAEKDAEKAKEAELKAIATMKKKGAGQLTDAELATAIKRLETEKRYRDLNPEAVSTGRMFVNEVVMPAAKEAGKTLLKDFITKQGKNLLGLNDSKEVEDGLAELKKEVENLRLKKEKAGYERDLEPKANAKLQEKHDRLKLEKEIKEYEEAIKPSKKNERSIDDLLKEYDKYDEETRKRIKDASSLMESIDKLKKKKKD